MKRFTLVCFLAVCNVTMTASAQYWGDVYGHASTVEEGMARGMADVIRSAGAANLMHSEAAKNYQDAQRKYIENRMQWTTTYFDMKRVNEEARKAKRGPAPTQEQLVRISQARLPDRLTQSQLDPVTGAIKWPIALREEVYRKYRDELDAIYRDRARNGYITPDQFLRIKQLTEGMMELLQQNVRKYPSSASIEARKFIEGLSYEASMDPNKG